MTPFVEDFFGFLAFDKIDRLLRGRTVVDSVFFLKDPINDLFSDVSVIIYPPTNYFIPCKIRFDFAMHLMYVEFCLKIQPRREHFGSVSHSYCVCKLNSKLVILVLLLSASMCPFFLPLLLLRDLAVVACVESHHGVPYETQASRIKQSHMVVGFRMYSNPPKYWLAWNMIAGVWYHSNIRLWE